MTFRLTVLAMGLFLALTLHYYVAEAQNGKVCVKQPPSKHPVCLIQADSDLIIEGRKCKSIIIEEHRLEIDWFQYSGIYEDKRYEGFWRCSWCWKCSDI